MPRKNTVSVAFEVTPAQRNIIALLTRGRGLTSKSELIRELLAAEARRQSVRWPDAGVARGKYSRTQRVE